VRTLELDVEVLKVNDDPVADTRADQRAGNAVVVARESRRPISGVTRNPLPWFLPS